MVPKKIWKVLLFLSFFFFFFLCFFVKYVCVFLWCVKFDRFGGSSPTMLTTTWKWFEEARNSEHTQRKSGRYLFIYFFFLWTIITRWKWFQEAGRYYHFKVYCSGYCFLDPRLFQNLRVFSVAFNFF